NDPPRCSPRHRRPLPRWRQRGSHGSRAVGYARVSPAARLFLKVLGRGGSGVDKLVWRRVSEPPARFQSTDYNRRAISTVVSSRRNFPLGADEPEARILE